ncbi:hypothetical protein CKAH01_05067 [Colletotrichum kahawae]|uniref:Uncharacterized protein n=1 Tax=Colletotrichum kahawae TaxID=34407 RepID=A0AAD9YIZ1_COLKA|nr:hypothetical protein CKAH01_05067 [Colletotrichum kahawae]
MQINTAAFLALLLAAPPVLARTCPANAIQCYYPNGRCAKWCPQFGCGCADNKNSLGGGLVRSKCITEFQWLGRHKC